MKSDIDNINEMKKIKHTPSARVKSVDKETGSVRFTLTEKAVDRHGEVVDPQGAKMENYLTNPIVLFGHGMGNQVPIGKVDTDTIQISDNSIEADVIFDESGDDPFAKMISTKVKNGFLNAGSIGFKPLEISEEKGLDGQTGVTHTSWELMEFSIVPIPALPSALATREYKEYAESCKSLGFDMPDTKDFEPTTADEENEKYLEEEMRLSELMNEKAGAVFSSANKDIINSAIDDLEKALSSLKDVIAKATSSDNEPMEAEPIEVITEETEKAETEIAEIRNSIRTLNAKRQLKKELVSLRKNLN